MQKAVDALNEKKKSITDTKVQEALKLVDAVFVNQEKFDVLTKSNRDFEPRGIPLRIWNDYMVNFLKEARPNIYK
ncbi:MAG: hypothetical protein ACLVJN_09195 [Streptococcus parasanguinis]